MSYTFDGVAKIISFDVSTTSLDVGDLWSRYVDWLSLSSSNRQYPPAMRTVGGDALPGSKKLGITYFMLNGWKIRPFGENHVFNVNGNLYSEDGSSPFTPAIGAYSVTIISAVSNLVDSTVQQLPEIEQASFANQVTIDVTSPYSGTAYPVGTRKQPVNNSADAHAILHDRGFNTFFIIGGLDVYPTVTRHSHVFIGESKTVSVLHCHAVAFVNTAFSHVYIIGSLTGDNLEFNDCYLDGVDGVSGELTSCRLEGLFKIEPGRRLSGIDLVFETDETIIDLQNTAGTVVSLDISSGIVTFKNAVAGCLIELNLRGGEVVLDASCTGGDFYAEGYGTLYNESAMNVTENHLLALETIPEPIMRYTRP